MMINIIWDLDGTLIDSENEIKKSLELALERSNIDISRKINDFTIGPTIDKIIIDAFPTNMINDNLLKKIIYNFRKTYDNSDFLNTKPYNGIEEIILNTEKYIHHIVTNKPDIPTKKILNIFKWSKCITSINTPYTKKKLDRKQTKNELFKDVIKYYNNNSIFIGIGDMKTDCIAARENGITSVGVLWGTGTHEDLKNY